jgi:hypothetical protein
MVIIAWLLMLLIPLLVLGVVGLLAFFCYKTFRRTFSTSLDDTSSKKTKWWALGSGSILTLLLLSLFFPPPAVVRKIECLRSGRTFAGPPRPGIDGFSDLTGQLSQEAIIVMLAERRVSFVEQPMKRASLDGYAPRITQEFRGIPARTSCGARFRSLSSFEKGNDLYI